MWKADEPNAALPTVPEAWWSAAAAWPPRAGATAIAPWLTQPGPGGRHCANGISAGAGMRRRVVFVLCPSTCGN